MVPAAVFSRKVQKFTCPALPCLDFLVPSSRRGRNWRGEAGKSKPDMALMTRGQGRVGAKIRGRNLSETREERRTASPSACVTGLPPQRGWRQPSLELFPPANISLSDFKQNCFQPRSPYARNVRSGNYPPPRPSAWQGLALAMGQSQIF